MIQTERLAEFVVEFMKSDNKQRAWDFYLHKIFDKSFDEFKECLSSSANVTPPEAKVETTVKESKNILNNFIPTEKG